MASFGFIRLRIYSAFGFGINRHKWSNKSVPSIQTMVWEDQKQCHDTTLRSQNAEQLRENGWLRCRCKPQSLKTYDSSEFGVWSSDKGSVQTAKLTKNYAQKTIEESHHFVVRTYCIVSSHVHTDYQTSASCCPSRDIL